MKNMHRYWVLLLVLAFTHAMGTVPAAADAAGTPSPQDSTAEHVIGIRLLDAPVDRRADPRAHVYIIDHVAPGSTIERHVEVTNESSTPVHIDLYAAAATIVNGEFTFAPQNAPNELTTWTSFDTTSLELAAKESARVHTTIRVPVDAAAGERYGVIWAQTDDTPDPTHNVTIVNRVGVRIYLDVGPGGEPPSDFRIEQLYPVRTVDGRLEIRARIHNTGGRALDISGTLSISGGPDGLSAGPLSAQPGTTLAPGDLAVAVVSLDPRLPNGPWDVELTLKSGLVKRTARTTITFPAAPGIGLVASRPRSRHIPILAVAGLSALVLAALRLMLPKILRHRR